MTTTAAPVAVQAPLTPMRPSPFVIVGDAPAEHHDFTGQSLFTEGGRFGVVDHASITALSRGLSPEAGEYVGSIESAGGL